MIYSDKKPPIAAWYGTVVGFLLGVSGVDGYISSPDSYGNWTCHWEGQWFENGTLPRISCIQ